MTPSFAGFSAGFTYVPDISQKNSGNLGIASDSDAVNVGTSGQNYTNVNARINRANFSGDMYLAGVSYKDKLGDVSLSANAAVGQLDLANTRVYQGGLQASYAGFTLGGSYFHRDVPNDARVHAADSGTGHMGLSTNAFAKAVMHAGTTFDVALRYTTGPYGVSLGYFQDKSKRDPNSRTNYGGKADSTSLYALSGRYTLGPGVEWRSSLYYASYENNSGFSNTDTENDGFALMTGFQVRF